ncbi:MAG TPA: OmpH family outer membrane protein [Candidatus Angelobacter sp.]|nr:OmpH family outer membrane protein [Candidatus Angelobacter sp.]
MSSQLKSRALTLAFALALGSSPAAFSQGAATAGASSGSKIGIVSIQDAIANTNEGKKELEALQQKFSPKQAELKTQNDDVENLKKQLQTQGDKLSEDERSNRVKAIETKQKALQRNYEDAQNEFQQAEQEIVNRLGKKMLAVLEKYAKDNGFAMVLDVSNPQTPVLWANQGSNITKELVDAYNAESPVAGAAKPATSSSATRPAGATTRPANGTAPTPKKP